MAQFDDGMSSDSDASSCSLIGVCFACKQPGHWSKNCPNRGPLSPRPFGENWPVMQCPCGAGPCVVLTSRTEKNPNRDFYKCPNLKCKYFKWCDEVGQSPVKQQLYGRSPGSPFKKNNDVLSSNPTCGCGAGKCIIRTMKDGPDDGRKYYACPIKKGQGACNYKMWLDSPAKPSEPKEDHISQSRISIPVLPNEPNKREVVHGGSPNNSLVRGQSSSYLARCYDTTTAQCELKDNCNEQLGRSNAKNENPSPSKTAYNHVRRFGSPGKSLMEIDQEHDQFKSCQVTEEPKKPETDYNGAEKNDKDSFILVDVEINEQEVLVDSEANKTNFDVNPEPASSYAAFLHVPPKPVMPNKIPESYLLGSGSPSKKLDLCDGSPGQCFRQYIEGHSMSNPGRMETDGASITLAPPLSLKRGQPDTDKAASTPKKLNLHYGSTSTIPPGECYRCGGLGHSTEECKKMTGVISNETNMEQMLMNPAFVNKPVRGGLGHSTEEYKKMTGVISNDINMEQMLMNPAFVNQPVPVSPNMVHGLNSFVSPPNRLECSSNTSRRGECYKCGRLGHWMFECPENVKTTITSNLEQKLGNAAFDTISPPMSPKRVHLSDRIAVSSPLKRSSLHGGSPRTPRSGECYTCEGLGHYSRECSNNLDLVSSVANPEQKLDNAAFIMISPPVSPKGVHTPGNSVASPLKRLTLSNGNQVPIKPADAKNVTERGTGITNALINLLLCSSTMGTSGT